MWLGLICNTGSPYPPIAPTSKRCRHSYRQTAAVGWERHIETGVFCNALVLTLWNLANSQTGCQRQSNGNAPWDDYIPLVKVIYSSTWGFQRCSFRQSGQCESLKEWNRATRIGSTFCFCVSD